MIADPEFSIWLRGTTFQKVVSLSLEIQLLGMLSLWLKVITDPEFLTKLRGTTFEKVVALCSDVQL